MPRAKVTPQEYNAILRRDGRRCQACGKRRDLQLDHVVPVVVGGDDDPRNLQLLCGTCNRRKGATYVDYRGWRGAWPLRFYRRFQLWRLPMLSILSVCARAGAVVVVLLAAVFLLPALAPLQALVLGVLATVWAAVQTVVLFVGGAFLIAWAVVRWRDSQLVYPDDSGQWPLTRKYLKRYPEVALQANQVHQKTRIIRAQHPLAGVTHYSVRPLTAATPELLPAPPAPLPLGTWFSQVVDHPGHVMLLGDTGSGKSTLARALLAERAKTDKVLILDPHATLNDWCGLPTVGDGRDFDDIDSVIRQLNAEFLRRFQPGEAMGQPVSVFIDEVPALAAEKKEALSRIVAWAREARKTGIRLVLLSQGWEVKSLGIQGEGSVRENFLFLRLGSFARAEVPDIPAHMHYPAVLVRGNDSKQEPILLDTAGLPDRTQPTLSPEVVWTPDPALLTVATATMDGVDTAETTTQKRRNRRKEQAKELYDAGERRLRMIEEQVFGYAGGNAHAQVERWMQEWEQAGKADL